MLHHFYKLRFRLRALFSGRRLENEMTEEMRHHLELQTDELRGDGVAKEEAIFKAQRLFGNAARIRESCRDIQSFSWLRHFVQDVRYGARISTRTPGFTFAAVIMLALGIGANTAIFSLVDEILWKPLPVKAPNQLVLFHWSSLRGLPVPTNGDWETDPETKAQTCTSFSRLTFDRFTEQNRTLTDLFAFADVGKLTLIADGSPEYIKLGEIVSGNFFDALGINPAAGRLISSEDDRADVTQVAVISYGFWQRRFGGDATVIGKTVSVNRQSVTIVGVTPSHFAGTLQVGDAPDIYLPLSMAPFLGLDGAEQMQNSVKLWWLRIMGRLRPDVSTLGVKTNLETSFQQTALESLHALGVEAPKSPEDVPSLLVRSGAQGLSELRNSYAHEWKILAGLAVTILIIACANIASLLLARGASRQHEIGIRIATGAGRGRIARQLLTESLLLSLLGGALAVPVALGGEDLLVAMQPPLDGHTLMIFPHLDYRIFAVAAFISILTGVLVGLLPALRAAQINITAEFQGGSGARGGMQMGLRSHLGKILLVLQVALSLVLVVGAGLFVQTLRNLHRVDPGFDPERILLFQLNPNADHPDFALGAEKNRQIAERIRALPQVQACTYSKMPLLSEMGWNTRISVPGHPSTSNGEDSAMVNAVSEDFFSTYGMPIVLGRGLTRRDETSAATVAVINQTMAKELFGAENPIGHLLAQKDHNDKTIGVDIVGVVRDAQYNQVKDPVPATIFFPFSFSKIMASAASTFAVRAEGNPDELIISIREIVRTVDPLLPLAEIRSQRAQIDLLSAHERLFAWLSGFFSLLAIGLVAIGLYGLMAFNIQRRTSEIGLRMATGASSSSILWMILSESLLLVGIGIVLGSVGAYLATRVISSQLYGLTATDPTIFAGSALLLLAIALFAGWLPARRAAWLEPAAALRCD